MKASGNVIDVLIAAAIGGACEIVKKVLESAGEKAKSNS